MPTHRALALEPTGLAVKAIPGDRSVLLAFDLPETRTADLAGFAIECTPPSGRSYVLLNRLSFTSGQTASTTPEQRPWTPSTEAPFQKFRWIDFPADIMPGQYTYQVTAMYFDDGTKLRPGASAEAAVEILPDKRPFPNFEMGFTRGYLSSQAYATRFHNAPYRPEPKTLGYSTAQYEAQYEWLGGHARQLVFATLEEARRDTAITVDLFAYDLDEPDFVRGLTALRGRLRAFLDNSTLHTKAGALEPEARTELEASAGAENVKVGHFGRFAHDKVIILKRNGTPYKVLTGSANFSVRGLYVQANNVLVFEDAETAQLYEDAFEQAFTAMSKFRSSQIASKWFPVEGNGLPKFEVSFAPHSSDAVSLKEVADAIQGAKSSVLFAIMELGGSGAVLDDVKALPGRKDLFSYGITQALTGINLYKPGASNAVFTSFAFLKNHVPWPFSQEWDGGPGQVIHDKFVVVDFNGAAPVVFTGSSNLASGGEENNGDNLLAMHDAGVASVFAVEAIRLVDHYHFRATLKDATDVKPLVLAGRDAKPAWWEAYYDPENVKSRERALFVE